MFTFFLLAWFLLVMVERSQTSKLCSFMNKLSLFFKASYEKVFLLEFYGVTLIELISLFYVWLYFSGNYLNASLILYKPNDLFETRVG